MFDCATRGLLMDFFTSFKRMGAAGALLAAASQAGAQCDTHGPNQLFSPAQPPRPAKRVATRGQASVTKRSHGGARRSRSPRRPGDDDDDAKN